MGRCCACTPQCRFFSPPKCPKLGGRATTAATRPRDADQFRGLASSRRVKMSAAARVGAARSARAHRAVHMVCDLGGCAQPARTTRLFAQAPACGAAQGEPDAAPDVHSALPQRGSAGRDGASSLCAFLTQADGNHPGSVGTRPCARFHRGWKLCKRNTERHENTYANTKTQQHVS